MLATGKCLFILVIISDTANNKLLHVKGNVLSNRTISELYFEKLCANRGIVCERIPEKTNGKSPVYRVLIHSTLLITEIKQLDPNDKDKEHSKTWGTPQSPGAFSVPKRVRYQLAKGNLQVKRLSEEKFPAMIVVYNNCGEWNLLNKFTIATAMFGSYGFEYESQPDQSIEVISQRYFGNRKVTKEMSRYLSVVGVLECKWTGSESFDLCCCHNPFAKVTIQQDLLAALATNHYYYDDPHDGKDVRWEPKRIEI